MSLKHCFANSPILALPQLNVSLILDTDTSVSRLCCHRYRVDKSVC